MHVCIHQADTGEATVPPDWSLSSRVQAVARPGAGRPGPTWSLPMDAHPPDTDSDHPADHGGARGAPCCEAQDALSRLASLGSPPPPTHEGDGCQGPLLAQGPLSAQMGCRDAPP